MKIFLKIINETIKGKCGICNKKVKHVRPLGFFQDDNIDKPVHQKIAMKNGFTVTKKTYKNLAELVEEGLKYEEVQESAHNEFVNLEE
jgi:hypothetical protein